ncbi:MAG: hypothetical protein Q8R02_07945 [Hyphomonadaceae bacterium]|nr:hypothetical protein [Hyphomonadaceae bacterium]
MSSSTSSSRGNAPLFLASMAGGIVLAIAAASLAPESWIHSGPEYGMATAFEDHIEKACADRLAPGLLIIGDSRAVAGVSVAGVRAAGIDAEKFALGGSGIFAGWATLDRLIDCGVRPKTVVMAYGTSHMIDSGAVMERTTNYDLPKGARAGHVYAMASEWEDRTARRLAYKAASIVGTEASLLDFVLMRPALRTVLAEPPLALQHHATSESERANFTANAGDRYYGLANGTNELPEEAAFEGGIRAINLHASEAIAELGRKHGFNVQFYILPVSETAKAELKPEIFAMAEEFRGKLDAMGIATLNDAWVLPDADFGDPSHVNARGRIKVTADFLRRLADDASLAKNEAPDAR